MFEGDHDDRDSDVRDAVLAYLHEHPRAMDSLEGIAQWWLVRQRVRIGVELVARALADLEDRGLLERLGENAHAMYRLRTPDGAAAGDGESGATGDNPVAGGA